MLRFTRVGTYAKTVVAFGRDRVGGMVCREGGNGVSVAGKGEGKGGGGGCGGGYGGCEEARRRYCGDQRKERKKRGVRKFKPLVVLEQAVIGQQFVMGQSEWMGFSFPKNFHLLPAPYIFIARTIIAAFRKRSSTILSALSVLISIAPSCTNGQT